MSRPEKTNRLSRLLGKRDKSMERPPLNDPVSDSAYASSETPTQEDTPKATPDLVPAEKNSEIGNIDRDRNLAVKPSTGEVFDEDSGELITVVTTTTTTTTTVRKPGGGKPEVHKDVKQDVHEETAPRALPPTSSSIQSAITPPPGPQEMPTNPAQPANLSHSTNPTIKESTVPDRLSSRPTREPYQEPNREPGPSIPIPARSAARKSGEFGNRPPSNYPAYDENLPPPTGGFYGGGHDNAPPSPSSPSRPNFSYPARNRTPVPEGPGAGLSHMDQPQHHSKSTMSDLKAAAKGIHGIGETLRGTLNSTIDDRYASKNPDKAAATRARNQEVLDRGRREVAGIPHQKYGQMHGTSLAQAQAAPQGQGQPQRRVSPPGKGQPQGWAPPPGHGPPQGPVSPQGRDGPQGHPAFRGPVSPQSSFPPRGNVQQREKSPFAPPRDAPLRDTPPVQRTKTPDQSVPGSWSEGDDHPSGPAGIGGRGEQELAESHSREEKKARSIGKLFKRKPVGPKEEGGLRVTNP